VKVVLTGGSGLLGNALRDSLRADGHHVVRLVRREPQASDEARWDPASGTVDPTALPNADAVVNLAGPGLGDRPWTPGYKREVLEARVTATRTIATAMAAAEPRPRTLLTSSAVGYYGNPGDTVLAEDSPTGDTYLARIAREWEGAAAPARDAGIRVAYLRTAVVVSATGGAFGRRLLPLWRLGLGGRIGSGRQWMSWVTLDDWVAAVRFLLEHDDLDGPFNISAPHPIRNAELTKAIGRVVHRPAVLWVPGPALTLPMRDFARDLLGGQRVVPERLEEAGFAFGHREFESALRDVLAGTSGPGGTKG
jgi:uncharacterized protein (TIGR01777 family)